ncbi:MAG: GNAT family N-acetyltransferase [Anaerolineae bacterium]|jgi:ribosomal-protein-alanine N-acetyltransferase|nr:GNAT family N-acetyltransferase [Anaerolineae bacterium]
MSDLLKNLPSLTSERLLLRQLTLEDAADMFEYAQDPEIARLGLWPGPIKTLAESEADLRDVLRDYQTGRYAAWAIVHDLKMIGRIGFHYFAFDSRAEVGYALNRDYWGQGYASEALQAVLAFSFNVLDLNRMQAIVLPENSASIRVLEKVGMTREGLLREYVKVGETFLDVYQYAMLKREWLSV